VRLLGEAAQLLQRIASWRPFVYRRRATRLIEPDSYAPGFALTVAPTLETQGLPGDWLQWQQDGVDVGEPDVAIVDFVGVAPVTRGVGENRHVITLPTDLSLGLSGGGGAVTIGSGCPPAVIASVVSGGSLPLSSTTSLITYCEAIGFVALSGSYGSPFYISNNNGASWSASTGLAVWQSTGIASNDVRVIAVSTSSPGGYAGPARMDSALSVSEFPHLADREPREVAYINGEFVMASFALISTDPVQVQWSTSGDDGTWTLATLPAGAVGDSSSELRLGFGGGVYVLFMWTAGVLKVWHSTDKITWSLGTLPSVPTFERVDCIAYGNGRFVATGLTWDFASSEAITLTSTDGASWQIGSSLVTPTNVGSNIPAGRVAFNGCNFLGSAAMFGVGTNLYASVDGVNWGAPTLVAGAVSSLAPGNDIWIGVRSPPVIVEGP
jgi:hypothetical protein